MLSAVSGACFRILLKKKKSLKRLLLSILLGIALGTFSVLCHQLLFEIPLVTKNYFGIFFYFFMLGYVLSDLIDSFMFIAKRIFIAKRR
jgi:uncharacterized membrane protein YczE